MDSDQELRQARILFNSAHQQESYCQNLIDFCEGKNSIVIQGYFAAGKMIFSKFKKNPFVGMKFFNEGKKMLEELIGKNGNTPELHYIRYTIQRNTPRFIGYYRKLEEDGAEILKFMKANPESELHKHILIYLEDTKDDLLKFL